jgi:uncharacterized protein (DUF1501 family)
LQLTGGNDGLSTVVPFGEDAYYAARPDLAHKPENVLAIDDYRGFHKSLVGLRARYELGEVAIIEGCGYPGPNRSHFKSMDIWHAADTRGRNVGDGWIGRLSELAWKKEVDANRVIHVGGVTPYSLESSLHPAASFVFPQGYRWIGVEGSMASYQEDDTIPEENGSGKTLDALRNAFATARKSSTAVRSAALRYRPRVTYPTTGIAQALGTAAALIQGGIGSRVISIEVSGFDTHNRQIERHGKLMENLDGALSAFAADLKGTERGDDTTLMAFSEFGRRVAQNGSKGTDHGVAGPMFVMGKGVRGGLYGAHPSLTELDGGDVIHSTDFRRVYGEIAESIFGVKSRELFGQPFDRLGFLPKS